MDADRSAHSQGLSACAGLSLHGPTQAWSRACGGGSSNGAGSFGGRSNGAALSGDNADAYRRRLNRLRRGLAGICRRLAGRAAVALYRQLVTWFVGGLAVAGSPV